MSLLDGLDLQKGIALLSGVLIRRLKEPPAHPQVMAGRAHAHHIEFRRLGAKIQVDGKIAIIEGVDHLTGAPMEACDLRAGAAMIIAGLAAQGTSEVTNVKHIERGYEDIIGKLSGLGADIRVVEAPDPEKQAVAG